MSKKIAQPKDKKPKRKRDRRLYQRILMEKRRAADKVKTGG